MSVVRAAEPKELSSLSLDFQDDRLKAMLPLYKARNFQEILTKEERRAWQDFRRQKLLAGKVSQLDRFFAQAEELNKTPGLTTEKKHLLEDLKQYGESAAAAI